MDYIFYQTTAINGFDALGHYLRAELIVNQCTNYAVRPATGCSANFPKSGATAAAAPVASVASAAGDDPVLQGHRRGAREGARPGGREGQARALQHEGVQAGEVQAREQALQGRPGRADARPRPRRHHLAVGTGRGRARAAGDRAGGHGDAHPDAVRRRRRAARLPVRRWRMSTRGGSGIAGNPVLIGAATILVVIVAVFLSYNANQGLPFVPTYQLKAELPSAANLVVGNDVKIGGSRVGTVSAITPQTRATTARSSPCSGSSSTRTPGRCPVDSTLLVRPRSALGLKYVEITRGTSSRHVRRRRHDPARAGARRRSSSTSSSTCSTPRRGRPRSRTCRASGPRSPAAASRSTPRSARSGRCCATSSR